MSASSLNRCSGQLGLGLILFALWGCATPGARVPMNEMAYTNPVYRWSVSYPGAWKVNAANPRSVTFQGAAPAGILDIRVLQGTAPVGILGIHALPDAESKSLDDAVNFALRAYPPPRYVTVSRRSMALPNGFSAIEIVHHIGSERVGKSRKVITVAKGRGFMIDAETYLDWWDTAEPYFNRIIDSFTVQD